MLGLKNVKTLTAASLLAALGILTGFFKIRLTDIIEIRFTILPLASAGALFGPGIAAVVGILSDIGGFILMPTGPYFPGFTLSGALSGVIFGLILKQKNVPHIGFLRITAAVIVNTVAVNIILNSVWLSMMYGKGGVVAVMSARLLKELIMIPINIVLLAAVLKPVVLLRSRQGISQEKME